MVILNKSIEFKLCAFFWLHSPEEECTERIALHETVKEPAYLLGLPNKFPLDCRQDVQIFGDAFESIFDDDTGLIHAPLPRKFVGVRSPPTKGDTGRSSLSD